MNSSRDNPLIEEFIWFTPLTSETKFDFGGITQLLDESDLIVTDSTFNVEVNMSGKTTSSSYAKSPGVLGSVV